EPARAASGSAAARTRARGFLRRGGALFRGALLRRGMRLTRERLLRRRLVRLALQRFLRGARALRRGLLAGVLQRALRALSRLLGGLAFFRRRQFHAGATRLLQSDGDRLFRAPRAVLAFADVLDLLAHELAGLRGRRLALALVLSRPADGFFLRHGGSPRH